MIEIERKFLVESDDYKKEAYAKSRIVQGFLNTDFERTVRVRINGEKGFLTVKGKSNEKGTTRFEWEKIISIEEAEALLKICEPGLIEKFRYKVKIGKHIFEVDEFLDANEGLVIAEVELESDDEFFEKPDWLGKEVTGLIQYYNSQLSKRSFKDW